MELALADLFAVLFVFSSGDSQKARKREEKPGKGVIVRKVGKSLEKGGKARKRSKSQECRKSLEKEIKDKKR